LENIDIKGTNKARRNAVTKIPDKFITVQKGMAGWYAVYFSWDSCWDDVPEVIQTGIGRYDNIDTAIEEAKEWAQSEQIPYME